MHFLTVFIGIGVGRKDHLVCRHCPPAGRCQPAIIVSGQAFDARLLEQSHALVEGSPGQGASIVQWVDSACLWVKNSTVLIHRRCRYGRGPCPIDQFNRCSYGLHLTTASFETGHIGPFVRNIDSAALMRITGHSKTFDQFEYQCGRISQGHIEAFTRGFTEFLVNMIRVLPDTGIDEAGIASRTTEAS